MAQTMIGGILKSNKISPENMMASAATVDTLEKVTKTFGIHTTNDNRNVVHFADILILAVKPDLHAIIINEIKNEIKKDVIIVTIAAGITLEDINLFFEREIKAIRTMPNTPCLVGEGMCAICPNEFVTSEELTEVAKLFQTFGKTEHIEEQLMDAIPAISGSSPAYIYMMIEAMADGGVQQGIPREKAYRLAAQAVLGAAKMILETGEHPGKLKDDVCTPGGATIEATITLEKSGFRGTVISAMESCTEKIHFLGQKSQQS